jgi:hypothetical protein
MRLSERSLNVVDRLLDEGIVCTLKHRKRLIEEINVTKGLHR